MSKNVNVNGVDYSGVSQVQLKTADGGTALFKDVDEITVPSGTKTITENGTYDVSNFASASVNVSADSGDAELYFTTNGSMYTKNLVIPSNVTSFLSGQYTKADNLETVESENAVLTQSNSSVFAFCPNLKSVSLLGGGEFGHYTFRNDTALKTVQLGSIGHPVTRITIYGFNGCTQSDLTITVYVNDDAELPLSEAPWGATAATIVYKSATTGEGITA